ncbi:MAG: class I SAM-dependent methyltransferase, partial [Deltaproteobacteria bacterium]
MFDEFKSEAFKEILELYLKLDVWYKGQAFFVSMIFAFSKSVHTFEKEKFLFMAWDDPRYRIKSKIYHCLATSDKSILDEFYKKNTVRSIFMLNRLLCRLSSVVLVIRKMIRRIRKSIYRHIYKLKEQQVPNAIRYHHLLEYLNQNHCNRILEIGVFRGETAKLMLQCSKNRNIEYHGIDLFEDGNSELAEKEMSLVADPMDVVLKKLKKHSEFVFLYKGYSTDVFLRIRDTDLRFDFIFIDGGHSYNTIRSDFENYSQLLSPDGIIFIDDYTKESLLPDVKKFIDDELLSNRQWDVNILDKWTDSYRGYNYKMVAVKFRVI